MIVFPKKEMRSAVFALSMLAAFASMGGVILPSISYFLKS